MRRLIPVISLLFLTLNANADAATITFSTPPFAGSTALTTPGRQVVGGELFTAFDIGADVFELILSRSPSARFSLPTILPATSQRAASTSSCCSHWTTMAIR